MSARILFVGPRRFAQYVGLKNIKERLENAYPGSYTLDISSEEGSVLVTLKLGIRYETV